MFSFVTNNIPSGAKEHGESTEPESHQTAKIIISSSSSSWQASSKLCDSFTIVSTQNSSILNSYGFIYDAIFFTCTHAHKLLSNKTIITQDCWIRNKVSCMKTGRVCHPLLTPCLNRACMVNDCSANTAYIYWGSIWGQTCCRVIDGKL